jgi:Ni/Fe-hydrogenase 1 B-type cytochrome subunit
VWELPVRVYHWINAVALVAAVRHRLPDRRAHPPFYAAEAYQQYWFGWVRFIHFLSAFVYVFNFLARLYWGFVGNKYAKWKRLLPAEAHRSRRRSSTSSRPTCFETKLHGPISTGHNALAGFIYFFTFLAFVFQTITGFALYSSMSNSWLPQHVQLDCSADGRRIRVRFWHHLFLWFFVTFIIVHIYLAFYHDYIEGRGTVSSIIGGWKFDQGPSEQK